MHKQKLGNVERACRLGVTTAVLALVCAGHPDSARAGGLVGETINVGITSWDYAGPNTLYNGDVLVEAGVTELNLLFWDDVVRVDLEEDYIEIRLTDIGRSFFLYIEGEKPLVFDFASVDPTGGELEILGVEVWDNDVLLDSEIIAAEVLSPTSLRLSIGDDNPALAGQGQYPIAIPATIRANLQLAPVHINPEPTTVSLLVLGGLAMATRRPRRRAC